MGSNPLSIAISLNWAECWERDNLWSVALNSFLIAKNCNAILHHEDSVVAEKMKSTSIMSDKNCDDENDIMMIVMISINITIMTIWTDEYL